MSFVQSSHCRYKADRLSFFTSFKQIILKLYNLSVQFHVKIIINTHKPKAWLVLIKVQNNNNFLK